MSFVLPRSPKGLRFTGQLRALELGNDAVAKAARSLGRGRPKVMPKPAPRASVEIDDSVPTPFIGSRPSARAEADAMIARSRGRGAARPDDDEPEEPTLALDRDPIEVVLGRAKAPPPKVSAPQGGVSSPWAARMPKAAPSSVIVVQEAQPSRRGRRPGGFPLVFWVVTALLVGMLAFHFVPAAFDSAFHALSL